MGLKVGKLPRFQAVLIIATMFVLFIVVLSGNVYSANPAPAISTDMHPGPGENITVSGQNFTPNGTAILYCLGTNVSTANADKNGNTSWAYTNGWISPYPVYAVDITTNVTSNTITVLPVLNDYTPTPTPTPVPTPFPGVEGICAIGLGIIIFITFKKK